MTTFLIALAGFIGGFIFATLIALVIWAADDSDDPQYSRHATLRAALRRARRL